MSEQTDITDAERMVDDLVTAATDLAWRDATGHSDASSVHYREQLAEERERVVAALREAREALDAIADGRAFLNYDPGSPRAMEATQYGCFAGMIVAPARLCPRRRLGAPMADRRYAVECACGFGGERPTRWAAAVARSAHRREFPSHDPRLVELTTAREAE